MTSGPSYTQRRSQQLRDDVVRTALQLFGERGYHETTIADIATRLGIGHGTIYRHFASKREVLDRVVDQIVERFGMALAAENAAGLAETLQDYRAQVERIARLLLAQANADPDSLNLLLNLGVDEDLAQRSHAFLEGTVALTRPYLEHGISRGFLRGDLDAEGTARVLSGMIIGGAVFALRGASRRQQHAYLDNAVELIFRGISA